MAMRYEFSRNACFHTSSGACEYSNKAMLEAKSRIPMTLDDPVDAAKLSAITPTISIKFKSSSIDDARNTFAIKLTPKQKVAALLAVRTRPLTSVMPSSS